MHPINNKETEDSLKAAFTAFVEDPAFPCVGAKAAFNSGSQLIDVYESLTSAEAVKLLARNLELFVHSKLLSQSTYATYIAIYREPRELSEQDFEALLWTRLHHLHQIDAPRHHWDPSVSSDPDDSRFSFSFAGRALYVIGLHAESSRLARRFPWPALVFNPHEQFERLRRDGKWRRMQKTIRERDVALQGNINPMLSDFGERSEARQYSGRVVEEEWRPPIPTTNGDSIKRCPFHH